NKKEEPAYGTDALRLWVASSEYVKDINIGNTVMKSVRRYRNTARFMLGNLNGFNYDKLVEYGDLKLVDKYALYELYQFGKAVNSGYEDFAFNRGDSLIFPPTSQLTSNLHITVVQTLNNFSSVTLSAFYFDMVKDRLYADHVDSLSRRSVQSVLYHVAPIVPHLAEEIYENYKTIEPERYDTLFKSGWYDLDERWNDPSISEEWTVLKNLRSEVNKLLEVARSKKYMEDDVNKLSEF
ncbi:1836_t:CDS:2, partial [Acaulospora colombiana]